jgi:transcriptional regulator with XRE-family HTH domain
MFFAEPTFAMRFRQRREARGWSQAKVAAQMTEVFENSMDQATIARIEKGARRINLTDAYQLAMLVGCTIENLLAPVRCEACKDFPPAGYACSQCGATR